MRKQMLSIGDASQIYSQKKFSEQQIAAVSQKAVETKQLSPRLAGEWLGIPILLSIGM